MRASSVMVVEDDEDIRSALVELLSMEGYAVATAANAKHGLRVTGQASPDAIVLDLMMPVMDGWDFIVRRRALPRCTDIPIIVRSAGYTLRTAAERLRDLGVRAVIARLSTWMRSSDSSDFMRRRKVVDEAT